MIYEKRTYTINPLKMADWLALYKSDAYAVQTEHLGTPFFLTIIFPSFIPFLLRFSELFSSFMTVQKSPSPDDPKRGILCFYLILF